MKYAVSALSLAAALAVPPALSAQAKPTDIYVSVVDGKGDPAPGLSAADFRVREDGVVREVLKAAPATEPMTDALLVDDSQAVRPAVQMVRDGIDEFVKALDGKGDLALVTFGERPTIAVDYTPDQKRLLDGAHRIFPRTGSGAYLLDAISEVSKGLQKRKSARAEIVVVVMDSGIEFSNADYENVLTALDKSGAGLHVISLGQPNPSTSDEMRNRNEVVAIGTERTGGRRDNVIAFTGAAPRLKQRAAELLNQYVVTYSRPDTLIPPEKIEVTVTKPELTARARTRTGLAGAR